MEIRLDLTRHCIETAAGLKVERLIQSYFKKPDKATGRQIKALTLFLQQADFQDLRHVMARERINGKVLLVFPPDPVQMEIRFKDRVILPFSAKTNR